MGRSARSEYVGVLHVWYKTANKPGELVQTDTVHLYDGSYGKLFAVTFGNRIYMACGHEIGA